MTDAVERGLSLAFWGSAALVAYTYAGYPLLLALWARAFPRPISRSAIAPKIVVIVVAHNEERRIAAKIETILAQDYPPEALRILVASDGSTDGTVSQVKSRHDPRVGVIAWPQRRGKAACLNEAVAACDEEIVVFTDARQRLHPGAVRALIGNFGDPRVGAVSGELVFETEDATGFGEGVDAYWRYEKAIRLRECVVDSTVGATGALYAIRRAIYRPIPPNTVLDDVLIPMNVVLQGYRVAFEPHALAYDHPARNAAQERVRKVRTLAGNFQLFATRPDLLLPWRNRIAFQFWSHKVLRLVCPWAMASALGAAAALASRSTLYTALLAAQLAFWGAALVGTLFVPARSLRPVRIAHAFLSLNWFAVLGLIEFLTNRETHLWRTRAATSDPGRPCA